MDSLKITLIFQNSKLGWAGLYFSAVEYVNAFEQYTGCIERKLTYPLSKNIIRVDLLVKSMPPRISSMTR